MDVDHTPAISLHLVVDPLTFDRSSFASLKSTSKRPLSLVQLPAFLPLLTLLFVLLVGVVVTATTSDPPSTARTQTPKETPPQRHMRKLYDFLFADYEKELRPMLNDTQPLTVTIRFWLKQILKVNERDQTIKTYLWLELYWTDELLTWDPAEFGGLDQIHVPTHKIWKPDILIYNNADVQQSELETNAMVNSRGEVILFRAMISSITCTLSLATFPFDQQVCFLTFASWSMDGSKLLLMPSNNSDSLELYIRNTEWELTDFSVKMYEKRYDCCLYSFPDITYFMVLKRSPAYYISTLIVPSAAITILSVVGLFTPHSSTGENTEKVSLGVNALLSMMVSGEVPATSEVIPLIGKFYIGLIFLIFTAAFTTTLTLAFQMRGNSGAPMSPRMKYILFEKMARSPLGAWVFAVQIGRKHQYANRAKGGPKNKENNTFIFDNVCVSPPTEFDGILANHVHSTPPIANTNGIKVKLRGLSTLEPGVSNNTDRWNVGLSTIKSDVKKRAKIVQMKELTGDLQKNSSVGLDTQQLLAGVPNYLPTRLHECINGIEESITKTHQQRNIEYEWEQAARIIERLLMLFFIVLTVSFAFFMLGGSGEDVKLTDEVMNNVKR